MNLPLRPPPPHLAAKKWAAPRALRGSTLLLLAAALRCMEAALLPWPSLAASPAPDAVPGAVTRYGPGIELFGDSTVVHALKRESANNAGAPQLQALVEACGGAEKWHGFVDRGGLREHGEC